MKTEANAQTHVKALDFLLQAILGFDDFSQVVADKSTPEDIRKCLIQEGYIKAIKETNEVFYHPTRKGRDFAAERLRQYRDSACSI